MSARCLNESGGSTRSCHGREEPVTSVIMTVGAQVHDREMRSRAWFTGCVQPGGLALGQPLGPAGVVVAVRPSFFRAAITKVLVKVLPTFTFDTSVPMVFAMA